MPRLLTLQRKKEQNYFQYIIQLLFSLHQIHADVKRATSLLNSHGEYFEVDVWIPDLKLGFEYQDKHHYATTWYATRAFHEIKTRDEMKANVMENKGFTLIAVPYWWENESSLIATIQQRAQRLDDLYTNANVIPYFPPNILEAHIIQIIPDVGELMRPTFMDSFSFVPSNWWMGEKFEGERGCWNPKYPALFSRQSRGIFIPIQIKQKMPFLFLDGEVWQGKIQRPFERL